MWGHEDSHGTDYLLKIHMSCPATGEKKTRELMYQKLIHDMGIQDEVFKGRPLSDGGVDQVVHVATLLAGAKGVPSGDERPPVQVDNVEVFCKEDPLN